jgi:hypothetical protein
MIARAWFVGTALWIGLATAWAQERVQDRVQVQSNEPAAAEASPQIALAIDDPVAVFGFVFGQLPEHVQITPTENYFYLRFTRGGVSYAGNIRLAAADRDQGKVHFAYSEQPIDWNPDPKTYHVVLGREHGIAVDKAGPLTYRVTRGAKSVSFVLNDLSKVKPPAGAIKPDETFLGPVFDESAMRFFLVFNSRLKIFHYVLDESAPVADQFGPLDGVDQIQIGKRTGFAFYQFDGRKILIGVNDRQSRLNTYLDGPFDQLPENFIEGEALREAIVAADPSARGKIDRLGNFADGSGRYLIHPYLLYRRTADLRLFHRCIMTRRVAVADRAACFVIGDDEAQRKNPRPLALKRR